MDYSSSKGVVALPGLVNLGNTCYMNAVLQALRMSPAFADALWEKLQAALPLPLVTDCVAGAWEELQVNMWGAPYTSRSLRPRTLMHSLRLKGLLAEMGAQGDAAEFAERFVDALQEADQGGGPLAKAPLTKEEEAFDRATKGSPLARRLYGLLQTKTTCGGCGARGAPRFEAFACLRVPVVVAEGEGEGQPALCLRAAFGDEELTDFACDACGGRCAASLRTRLAVLPPNLLLVVKRFDNEGRKLTAPIAWDAQEVDLTPYTTPQQREEGGGRYIVVAVVQHAGIAAGGHYTTHVRGGDSRDQTPWVLFDDARADAAAEGASPARDGGAYLLLLCRPSVWDAFVRERVGPLREAACAALAAAEPIAAPHAHTGLPPWEARLLGLLGPIEDEEIGGESPPGPCMALDA